MFPHLPLFKQTVPPQTQTPEKMTRRAMHHCKLDQDKYPKSKRFTVTTDIMLLHLRMSCCYDTTANNPVLLFLSALNMWSLLNILGDDKVENDRVHLTSWANTCMDHSNMKRDEKDKCMRALTWAPLKAMPNCPPLSTDPWVTALQSS